MISELKPKFDFKSAFKEAKASKVDPKTDEARPLVDDSVDYDAFVSRYSVARIYAFINIVFIIMTFISLIVYARDFFGITLCLLALVIFLLSYLKVSFRLWMARSIASNWSSRAEPKFIMMNDFAEAILVNPIEILPIKIFNEGK